MNPVFPTIEESLNFPTGWRAPVVPQQSEKSGFVGLRCEFCGRFFKKLGIEGRQGVRQVEVNKTGVPGKKTGGTLVWRCWKCFDEGVTATLDNRVLVVFPLLNKAKARKMIQEQVVNSLLLQVRNSFWNWRK
jgi:hypothetical protein